MSTSTIPARSAAAAAAAMPEGAITLDDVAAMAEHDENHRYELSAAGVVEVMSPPPCAHQLIITRLMGWLIRRGYADEQILTTPGTHVGADNATGGRMPDLTVWAAGVTPSYSASTYVSTAGLLVAIEVVSKGSYEIDFTEKRREYAGARIPRYWIIDDDAAHTVYRFSDPIGADRTAGYATTTPLITLDKLLTLDPRKLLD
jgi:Uma2 family endonuclease